MLVKYYLVPKSNPLNREESGKYYAVVDYNGDVTYRDLINRITDYSTVNSPDVMAVLESLFMLIPQQLFEGKIVRLGELGTLRLVLRSEGTESEEDFTEFNIKNSKVRLYLSKEFKKKLRNIEYARINHPKKSS